MREVEDLKSKRRLRGRKNDSGGSSNPEDKIYEPDED